MVGNKVEGRAMQIRMKFFTSLYNGKRFFFGLAVTFFDIR